MGPVGGCSEEGILVSVSKRKRKVVVRELDHIDTRVGLPSREAQTCPLTFIKDDLKGILMPHNDPLVIIMNIMGTKQPCNIRILGFWDAVSIPEGIIRLVVELVLTEDPECCLTRMPYFLIVEQASTYNGETLPQDSIKASRLRIRSARYTMINDRLYKWGFSLPLLKCITKEQGWAILQEIHNGICRNHIGGHSLALKTIRQGYY
ncbi:hypothetical protein ACS0TY_005254 [Phlomoides rotata]